MVPDAKCRRPPPLKLCIGNVEEFYQPYLKALDERARRRWRASARRVGGAALLWNLPQAADGAAAVPVPVPVIGVAEPGRVVVLPTGGDEALISQLAERLGLGVVEVISPVYASGRLCVDLLHDARALGRITGLVLGGGAVVEVAAWGETEGLCELIRELERRGVQVRSPYGRRGNLDKTARLDSKAGLRALAQGFSRNLSRHLSGHLSPRWSELMPEGEVAGGGLNSVVKAAVIAQRMAASGAVVVKAALSTSGVGQVRIGRGRYTVKELTRRLEFAARAVPELAAWPLVVERWHLPAARKRQECRNTGYSAQCVADGVGGARVLFTAVHKGTNREADMAAGGDYSAAIGARAVGLERAGELETLAQEVGEEVSGWGYSGVFGVDFVVDEEDTLRLVEVNARRTTLSAGGELLKLAQRSGGGEEGVVLYFERLAAMDGCINWQVENADLSRLLFPIGGSSEGWVPLPSPRPLSLPAQLYAGENTETSSSGFVVAPSLARAEEVATAVCRVLRAATGGRRSG